MLFHFDFLEKIRGIAKANRGMAKALMSTLKPSNEIIQSLSMGKHIHYIKMVNMKKL